MKDLTINLLLKSTESKQLFRILWISVEHKEVCIFNCETQEMPKFIPYEELQKQIAEGIYSIQKSDPFIYVESEAELSENKRKSRNAIWNIMQSAITKEPEIYLKSERGKLLSHTAQESGKPLKMIHRYLKIYWQRGKTKNAFIPAFHNRGAGGRERGSGNQKRGRPRKYGESPGVNVDDKIKSIFESAIRKHYHTRNENTLQYAYDMMIKEHFTRFAPQTDGSVKAELLSSDKIPTMGQFRYWYNKKHNVAEKIRKRKGDTKFELDHRAVTGKSDYGIMGPGAKYQIDATIGDIYLVSRFNRADIIGRPVLYFVIDIFSRMVAGMYVGLEGPSWAGSMMAIANACTDKVKYCAEYGITISAEEWPCVGVPGAILGDRGEMESKSVEMIINAFNVRVENAVAYRGDMKGIIEQYFNKINNDALKHLPGHVKRDAGKQGSEDYRLKSILDIYQLTQILIRCVLYHNNQHFHKMFERTADMIADDVPPIPLQVWNWGITHCSGSLRTFPENTIKLCLMPSDTASVTAKGIRFKGIYYLCERAASEHWFETARAKGAWKVNISYDPRNMNTIYIRGANGTVDVCWLSEWQEKYHGKCLYEIEKLHDAEKNMQRGNVPKEMTLKAELSIAIDAIITEAEEMARQTAIPKSKAERTKNIRANRALEKEQNRKEETFSLGNMNNKILAPPETREDENISPTMKMILKDLEERLNGGS